jgi:hypothetical protein
MSQYPYEARVQDFLAALTEAELNGKPNLWELAVRYDIPAAEAQSLARMVRSLDAAFEDVRPSSQFKKQLRQELIGETETENVFRRVLNLPPRLQWAAAVALVAAMALLGRKRLVGEARSLLDQVRKQAENSGVEVLNS